MVAKLKSQYGSGIREANTYLGQNYLVLEPSIVSELLQILRDREQFDYCVDITAVHYPQREKQFDLSGFLYSFPRNERIRVKTDDRGRRKHPQRSVDLGNRQLAGARSVRHVWHPLRWASGFEAHPAARWLEGLSAAQRLRHHSTGSGMGAGQPGDRERPIIMTDRTITDPKAADLKTDEATRFLSHLELGRARQNFSRHQ